MASMPHEGRRGSSADSRYAHGYYGLPDASASSSYYQAYGLPASGVNGQEGAVSGDASDPYAAWAEYYKANPEYYEKMVKAYSDPAAMSAYYSQYYGASAEQPQSSLHKVDASHAPSALSEPGATHVTPSYDAPVSVAEFMSGSKESQSIESPPADYPMLAHEPGYIPQLASLSGVGGMPPTGARRRRERGGVRRSGRRRRRNRGRSSSPGRGGDQRRSRSRDRGGRRYECKDPRQGERDDGRGHAFPNSRLHCDDAFPGQQRDRIIRSPRIPGTGRDEHGRSPPRHRHLPVERDVYYSPASAEDQRRVRYSSREQ